MSRANEKMAKEHAEGTLKGAFASGLDVHVRPRKLRRRQLYNITVPRNKRAGDRMAVTIEGRRVELTIPKNFDHRKQTKFPYIYPGDVDKVIASTLQSVPGHQIIVSKPIIWSSVSLSWNVGGKGQEQMEGQIGNLMQEVQEKLLARAIDQGCNAVLGINFNVTSAGSGERGNLTTMIVAAYGTPCSVIPLEQLPSIPVEAVPYEDEDDVYSANWGETAF